MEWGLVWLMVILKIPIFGLFWIIWWAVKDPPRPETTPDTDDGPRRPRPLAPMHPRRGPHTGPGAARVPSPPRTRTAPVRARVERD